MNKITTTTATNKEKEKKNERPTTFIPHGILHTVFFFNSYFIIYIFIESLKVILGLFRPVRD